LSHAVSTFVLFKDANSISPEIVTPQLIYLSHFPPCMVLHSTVVCPHGNGEGSNPNLDAKKGQDFHFDLCRSI